MRGPHQVLLTEALIQPHKALKEGALFFVIDDEETGSERLSDLSKTTQPSNSIYGPVSRTQAHVYLHSSFSICSKCTSPLSHLSAEAGDSCYMSLPPVAVP